MKFDLVILLTGQSNALGVGGWCDMADFNDRSDANIYGYNSNTRSWGIFDLRCDIGSKLPQHQCLAFHFAKQYTSSNPHHTVGIIVCGEAGVGICRWIKPQQMLQRSSVNKCDTGDIYTRSVTMVNTALKFVENSEIDVILWHQGENDFDESTTYYYSRLNTVVSQYRSECFTNENVLFIAGELLHNNDIWAFNRQNIALHCFNEDPDARCRCAKTKNLSSNVAYGDYLHFSSEGHRAMGRRYYETYCDIKRLGNSSSTLWKDMRRFFSSLYYFLRNRC